MMQHVAHPVPTSHIHVFSHPAYDSKFRLEGTLAYQQAIRKKLILPAKHLIIETKFV